MKRILNILALLLLCGISAVANAQVKGHTYYCFDVMVGAESQAQILLEVENNGSLALGQITYQNGEQAPVGLYGHRDRENPDVLRLEEHTANGQWTGSLKLVFDRGVLDQSEWRSPLNDQTLPVRLIRTRPFPYTERSTFFAPATADQIGGHYINYVRQGKALSNDRALNVMPYNTQSGRFSIEHSAFDVAINDYRLMGGNEFMNTTYTTGGTFTFSVKFYADFALVTLLLADEGTEAEAAKAEGFYIREKGVKEVTAWGYQGLYSLRARLEDGVPYIMASKRRLELDTECWGEPGIKSGKHAIPAVAGRVKDIYISDIGMDINPLLCLLLDDGRVQAVSLAYARQTGVTTASEPLPNIADIQYFMPWDPTAPVADVSYYTEEAAGDEGSSIFAIDGAGAAHRIGMFYQSGSYMLNPIDTVESDTFLGLSELWEIYIIENNHGNKGVGYFGNFWLIDEADDQRGQKIGYRMHSMRKHTDMEMKPCSLEGSFYINEVPDSDNFFDKLITPAEGNIKLTPKGKPACFKRMMDGVG